MRIETKAALVKGLFFFTTHMLPYRPFKAAVRAIFGRQWREFEAATRDPHAAQSGIITGIVGRNAGTEFGRAHSFDRMRTAADFRSGVPVAGYDAFAPMIERIGNGEKNVLTAEEAVYFARTSGSTGSAKNIPVTAAYLDEFKRAQRMWYRNFALQFPGMIKGNPLTIVSNRIEGRTACGIPYGSLSRPLTFRESELADRVAAIPREAFHVGDFNSKYYLILRMALSTRISTIAAVNPSTIMMFAKKLNEFAPDFIRDARDGTLKAGLDIPPALRQRAVAKVRPDAELASRLERLLSERGFLRPIDVWPMLCGLACWKGGSAGFYLSQFSKHYGTIPVMEFGFVASEGHFSIPLDASSDSGVFSATSHFCEFIPEAERSARPDDPFPRTLLAHELEIGKRYFIIVTASNGLYRYDINDIVEVTGFFNRTPMLRFVHKGGNMLSITGEKVGESHVVRAVTRAAESCGVRLDGFSVSIRLDETPRYVFAVEIPHEVQAPDLGRLLNLCDAELCRANIEYESKRRSERLGPPVLLLLRPGSFERHRIRRVAEGAPDAHVKPPHLFRSEEELQKWLDVAQEKVF
jgi:hypothetical protein